MEAREKVTVKAGQIVEVLNGCNDAEVLTVITTVLNKINMPHLPILIVGNMAKVMNCDQVVITEDEGGWDAAFRINKERLSNGLDWGDELEAEEYHEDENPTDSSSPSDSELDKIEKESIIRALQRNHGNRKKAAEDLHISQCTLFRKIEKYGITKEVINK